MRQPDVMDPESAAAALLAAAEEDIELPIDVNELAEEHLGLDVQEHADLMSLLGAPMPPEGATLSGLLFPSERRIWVNAVEAGRWPGRRRFTIAHEIGHWQLHRDGAYEAHARFCRSDEVEATGDRARKARNIEREANQFAAALLMPEELVRSHAEELRRNVGLLARRFDVSGTAMEVRLDDLGLLPPYMRR